MAISFDEEKDLMRPTSPISSDGSRGMSGWMVRKGLAANQTSADLTLVLIIAVAIAVGFAAYKIGNRTTGASPDASVVEQTLNATHNGAGRQ